eukprot:TRINITY_DN10148_c0_g1_i1.p1 TRINITY_DN10148_c0_g1~~TRINITY_DN10148_c0_g1_i1.p1  ORF type:complete len:1408 (-),score=347.38 TRINITY_DN10148_c0_g1_i1:70-4293(-)
MQLFRETPLHIFESQLQWRDLAITAPVPQQPVTPAKTPRKVQSGKSDFASGYAFTASRTVRNRYLHWRVVKDILELVDISLDYNLLSNACRIQLPSDILPDVFVTEFQAGDVQHVAVMAATSSSVHRLIFRHPSALSGPNESIFARMAPDVLYQPQHHIFGVCKSTDATVSAAFDFQTMVLGCSNGAAYVYRLPSLDGRSPHVEVELREASIMQRLWTGITRTSSGVPILSISAFSYQQDVVVVTLSADNVLRVWSTARRAVIASHLYGSSGAPASEPQQQTMPTTPGAQQQQQQQRPTTPGLSMSGVGTTVVMPVIQSHRQMRLYPANGSLHVVVCGNFGGVQFVLLSLNLEQPVGAKWTFDLNSTIFAQPGHDQLVDFCVAKGNLWALWQLTDRTALTVCTVAINQGVWHTSSWRSVVLRHELELIPSQLHRVTDPEAFFLNQVFQPGRFPQRVIWRAIQSIRRERGFQTQQQTTLEVVLKQKVTEAINERLRTNEGEDGLTIWLQFFNACIHALRAETNPCGLICGDDTDVLSIASRSGLSLLRPCSIEESVCCLFDRVCLGSPSDSAEMLMQRAGTELDPVLTADALRLLACSVLLSDQLQTSLAGFDESLFYQVDPVMAAIPLVSWLADGVGAPDGEAVMADQRRHARDFNRMFVRMFVGIRNPLQAIEDVLQLLQRLEIVPDDGRQPQPDALAYCADLFASPSAENFVNAAFRQMVATRFNVTRNLVLLLLYIARVRRLPTTSNADLPASELLGETIPRVSKVLQSLHATLWLANQAILPSTRESGLKPLPLFQLAEPAVPGIYNDVLQLLFRHNLKSKIQRTLAATLTAANAAISVDFYNRLLAIAFDTLWVFERPETAFEISSILIRNNLQVTAQEYVRLLSQPSPGSFLVNAVTSLNMGAFVKARDFILMAAIGSETEDPTVQRFIADVVPKDDVMALSAPQYYFFQAAIQLFEQRRQSACVVQIAYNALRSVDARGVEARSLWSVIFKHELLLEHYAESFTAIVSNPDRERREDCARRLATVLSERGQVQLLCSLPLGELLSVVEAALMAQARASDITMQPNYYHVMYAFHVYRGNYRQAGNVMFQYAQRLTVESRSRNAETLQSQCNALLAALNAFRLIDSKHAWVLLPASSPLVTAHKRKLDGATPEPTGQQQMVVLELPDMEKQLYLASARVRLVTHDSAYEDAGALLASERDTLSLLLQAGLFDTAFSLAHICDMDMQLVFEHLTRRCLQLEYDIKAKLVLEDDVLVRDDDVTAVHGWEMLQRYLCKHDSAKTNYRFHQCVAETMLTHHDGKLPPWLVTQFRERNVSALLRTLVRYDVLDDALVLATAEISRLLADQYLQKPTEVSMYAIDELLAACELRKNPELNDSVSKLQAELDKFFHMHELKRRMVTRR